MDLQIEFTNKDRNLHLQGMEGEGTDFNLRIRVADGSGWSGAEFGLTQSWDGIVPTIWEFQSFFQLRVGAILREVAIFKDVELTFSCS